MQDLENDGQMEALKLQRYTQMILSSISGREVWSVNFKLCDPSLSGSANSAPSQPAYHDTYTCIKRTKKMEKHYRCNSLQRCLGESQNRQRFAIATVIGDAIFQMTTMVTFL